jgi:hypothetical protein
VESVGGESATVIMCIDLSRTMSMMHFGGLRDRGGVSRAGKRIEMLATIVRMQCVFMATEVGTYRRIYDLFRWKGD